MTWAGVLLYCQLSDDEWEQPVLHAPASAGLDWRPWYHIRIPFCSHGSRDLQGCLWITRACHEETCCTLWREHQHFALSLSKTFPTLLEGWKYCLRAIQYTERRAFPGKTHYGLYVYGPWGGECTGYVSTNQAGLHYNLRCNMGCWKSSREFLNKKSMTTLETSQLLYARPNSNTQHIAVCVLVRRIGWMFSLTGNATYSPR